MREILRSLMVCATLSVVACGEKTTEIETPRAVVTSGPTAVELIPGGAKYIVYSVERLGGFEGSVQLSVNNVPTGVTAKFEPPIIDNASFISKLEIAVSPTASSGTYTINTIATGSGVQSTEIPVTITIVVPDISIAAVGGTLSMEQGKSSSVTLDLTRVGGFGGVVGLSVVNVPDGLTASLSSATLRSGDANATLTLTAELDAPVGNKSIVINASSPGIPTKSITVPVMVTTGTTPAVRLSTPQSFLHVVRGTTGEIALNVERFVGYADALTVAVEGLPPNVTATVAPVAAGQTSTTLIFTAAGNATAPLQSLVTLRAKGTGIADATLPFTVSVLEMPTFRFNFTRSGPNSEPVGALGLEVTRGTPAFGAGAINRISGFSEPVMISLVGLPAGITATMFAENGRVSLPAQLAASVVEFQNMSLNFEAAPEVAPGLYEGLIRGVSTSGITVDANVSITVK